MPTPEQILAGHRPTRNTSIKTVIPSPQELAAREPDVEVYTTSGGIEFVRTPEERFRDLAGFPFEVSKVEIDGLRMPLRSLLSFIAPGRAPFRPWSAASV